MDGENNGKPYEQMDDLGGKNPLFLETPVNSEFTSLKKMCSKTFAQQKAKCVINFQGLCWFQEGQTYSQAPSFAGVVRIPLKVHFKLKPLTNPRRLWVNLPLEDDICSLTRNKPTTTDRGVVSKRDGCTMV